MHKFSLPVDDPMLVFMVVLLIVLLTPVILKRTNTPAIIGLIIVGVIIGPNSLNIIGNNDTIELFSRVGLLYIMFQAGLEIEFTEFRRNSLRSITFGIATFLFPFLFGYGVAVLIYSMDNIPAILIGIMLASNTLIAYPIAGKLGIGKTPSVTTAVSGTVIADTIVLVVLAFLTAFMSESEDAGHIWRFIISFSVFTFTLFFLLPVLSRWFFKTLANDGNLQFLYALSILFASAFASELAGAEPIIGVFFAGLALNRLIPSRSLLMNRIDFVGNTLFIPFFLLSVGMLVDVRNIFGSLEQNIFALVLIIIAIGGKWLAALITKVIFKLTKNEYQVIFGLTTARAAATLAIVLVGLNYGVLSDEIFNGIILLIMVTSLFSSIVTGRAGKKLALEENNRLADEEHDSSSRILVPVANPVNMGHLIDLAVLLYHPGGRDSIYPLAVVQDNIEAKHHIVSNRQLIDGIIKQASASEIAVQGITRIDVNIPTAISRVSKELNISDIILGWSEKTKRGIDKLLGNMLETILENTSCNIIVSQVTHSITLTSRVMVFVPANAEKESGFNHWASILAHLVKELGSQVTIYTVLNNRGLLGDALKKHQYRLSYKLVELSSFQEFDMVANGDKHTLYIFINSRKQTLSYSQHLYSLTYYLPEALKRYNVLNIYPPVGG